MYVNAYYFVLEFICHGENSTYFLQSKDTLLFGNFSKKKWLFLTALKKANDSENSSTVSV